MEKYLVWFISNSGCKYWLMASNRKDALARFASYNGTSVSAYLQCRKAKAGDNTRLETHLYQTV